MEGLRRRRADLEHDFFATVVEDSFSEILAFDAETLNVFLANKSLRQNLGYAAGEIVGLDVAAIKAEFSPTRLKEIYRPLLEGETTRIVVHTRHRRKDGSTYPVEVHSRKSRLEGRVVIFQIAIDQTEIARRQITAELASLIERDAAESRDRAGFLAGLLTRLARQFRCQIAHAHFWNAETARLESSGLWHVEAPGPWQAEFRRLTGTSSLASGEGLPGKAHQRKEAVVMERLGDNPDCPRRIAFCGMPISAGFALPVMAGGECAAVLEFFSVQDLGMEIWPELTHALGEQIGRLYERKGAEEQADESRERFDAAVNGAAVGLWDYDYRKDRFYLSPRCREILQIGEGEDPPNWKEFGDRIHPADMKRAVAAMKAHMLRRTPYDVEYRFRLGPDRFIWLHSMARGVWDEQGRIVRTAGTIEDVSAEKEAESVQREVLACIAAPGDLEAKISDALDKVCRYLGMETALVNHIANGDCTVRYRSSQGAGPAAGETMKLADAICSDVYAGDTLQAFADLSRSPAANHPARARRRIEAYIGIALFVKGVRFGTLSFTAPQPRAPFGEAEIAMVRLLGIWIGEEIGRALDVAELVENDLRLSSKLASAADALLTVDDAGRIEDANPAAAGMFGWTAEEMRGAGIGTLLPTVQSFSHPDGRLIPVRLRQDIAARADGTRLAVLLSIAEIRVGGRTLFTVAISDLTGVKQAETAKGEFISVVSHELRTPLTSIRGALALIAAETTGKLTPESRKLADVAQRNCERLLRLVNDILAIDKLESGRFEMSLAPLDLNALVRDAAAANALYAAKFDARFALCLADDLPPVIADGERLMQVMANLLSNAAKFTRPGSAIHVTTERAGRHARIAVRDEGAGIPEAMRERIFEKFVQAENVNTRGREGSGLGLSIARRLVELMNGEIGFVSEAGSGTTFTVSLPMAFDGVKNPGAEA